MNDATLVPSIRRIVTGTNAEGLSCIDEDGSSPSERTVDERPGYRVTNLWCTHEGEGPDAPDRIASLGGVRPPARGTVFRIIDVPAEPVDAAERQRAVEATFKQMFSDAHRDASAEAPPHPAMHATPTVDYAMVLSGEMIAILDTTETVMKAGDVLIQRGTSHAWANRSGAPARIAFVLIDAPQS